IHCRSTLTYCFIYSYSYLSLFCFVFFFFFNDTAPPEIYTLSLHDALPISDVLMLQKSQISAAPQFGTAFATEYLTGIGTVRYSRSEEHTSELQSRENLVCRLLLEKKKRKKYKNTFIDKKVILNVLMIYIYI